MSLRVGEHQSNRGVELCFLLLHVLSEEQVRSPVANFQVPTLRPSVFLLLVRSAGAGCLSPHRLRPQLPSGKSKLHLNAWGQGSHGCAGESKFSFSINTLRAKKLRVSQVNVTIARGGTV